MNPGDVCRRACLTFDETSVLYTLKSYGIDFYISPGEKRISGSGAGSSVLLNRLGYFFNLSVPWYLVSAKEIPLTGRLIKPLNLKGGQLFFRGTHMLPLDKLAEKHSGNTAGFIERGKEFGAHETGYGDASFRLFPLPRVPVELILWAADDEFPPRAELLFDSSCELHLPLDIIWSVAMMSLLIML